MTIKPIKNQKSNEKNKEHGNSHNQVDQQVPNSSNNNHRNLNSNVETFSPNAQRRNDVFEDIARHRRSPHKSGGRQKRNNDHLHSGKRLNENREKCVTSNVSTSSPTQYSNQHHGVDRINPHYSHSSVININTPSTAACLAKSPKHNNNDDNDINNVSLNQNDHVNEHDSVHDDRDLDLNPVLDHGQENVHDIDNNNDSNNDNDHINDVNLNQNDHNNEHDNVHDNHDLNLNLNLDRGHENGNDIDIGIDNNCNNNSNVKNDTNNSNDKTNNNIVNDNNDDDDINVNVHNIAINMDIDNDKNNNKKNNNINNNNNNSSTFVNSMNNLNSSNMITQVGASVSPKPKVQHHSPPRSKLPMSSNISNLNIANNDILKQLEETLNGYNSGDEWIVPKEGLLTADEWTKRDQQFGKAIEKRGLIIKDVEEDGACLFRAISLQIYGDQEMHDFIRQQTMDYIYQNSEYFAQFVTEDINNYVRRKRNIDSHGNHIEIQAMSELYNRPVELYCYQTNPINIFNSEQISNGQYPLRLSYHRGSHYNAILDPYCASVGVGLGLAGYKPESQTHEAIKLSEQLEIEQTMFEDKLKTTDWEATNEALQEQVARESYLQWCRENMLKSRINDDKKSPTKSRTSTISSSSTSTNSTITSAEAFKNSHFMKLQSKNQTTTVTFTESNYITSIKTTTASMTLDKRCHNDTNNNKKKRSKNDDIDGNNDLNNDKNIENNKNDSNINDNNDINNNDIDVNIIENSGSNSGVSNDNTKIKDTKINYERKMNNNNKRAVSLPICNNNVQNYVFNNQIKKKNCNNNEMIDYGNMNDKCNSLFMHQYNNDNKNDIMTDNSMMLNKVKIPNETTTNNFENCDSDDTDMSSTSSIEPNSEVINSKKGKRKYNKNNNNTKLSSPLQKNEILNEYENIERTKSRRLKRRYKEISSGSSSSGDIICSDQNTNNHNSLMNYSKKSKTTQILFANENAFNTKNNNINYNNENCNNQSDVSSIAFNSESSEKIVEFREKSNEEQPSTSNQLSTKEKNGVSSFYQSLLESSYTDDGIGQLTENEMIQKAIQMSRMDYFEDQKLKCGYFQVQHQDNDDDST